jgi:hypothetical protein
MLKELEKVIGLNAMNKEEAISLISKLNKQFLKEGFMPDDVMVLHYISIFPSSSRREVDEQRKACLLLLEDGTMEEWFELFPKYKSWTRIYKIQNEKFHPLSDERIEELKKELNVNRHQ